jgi:LysR family transcriptional activator of nhaA
MFTIGGELTDVLKGRPRGRAIPLMVGISDAIPKLIAYRILEPALAMTGGVQLVCREDNPDRLFLELSAHELDLVLADAPAGASVRVRLFNHLLGSCGVGLFAPPRLAARYRRGGFPKSLDGAPFLLPMENSPSRRSLREWFDANGIRPQVIGEFQDSALMSAFGGAGAGIFAAPIAIEAEVIRYYRVVRIGVLDGVVEQYYAVSAERKIKHPAVAAITQSARQELFAAS